MLDDGKGACFVVLLPIDKESYSADELASRSAEQSEVFPISNDATPAPKARRRLPTSLWYLWWTTMWRYSLS